MYTVIYVICNNKQAETPSDITLPYVNLDDKANNPLQLFNTREEAFADAVKKGHETAREWDMSHQASYMFHAILEDDEFIKEQSVKVCCFDESDKTKAAVCEYRIIPVTPPAAK